METYTKINETTVEAVISTPDRVVRMGLDVLIRQKASLTARMAEIDKKIADIKALGVKAVAETLQEDIIKG